MAHPITADRLSSALAIIGRTGSGKTFTAKGAVEELLRDGRRTCIIDPTGAWWGLRLDVAGTQPSGLEVVIVGGDHGDVPLSPDSGERLGALVAGSGLPYSVVDISEFSNSEMTRFLTAFLETLYAGNRTPLHLVMDEADMLAPQNPMPEQRRLQGVVNKIVRRGRIKGFRPLMITQRPQVIDKSVLSQVDGMVAMRLTSPQDRKAILDWVKGHAGDKEAVTAVERLPGLPVGSGFLFMPAEEKLDLIAFPAISTFDSSKAPEHGAEPVRPVPLSQIDLGAVRRALAITQEETTPRREGRTSPHDMEAAEQRGYERGLKEGMQLGLRKASEMLGPAMIVLNDIHTRLGGWQESPKSVAPKEVEAGAEPPKPSKPRAQSFDDPGLNSAARKMLAVLDTNPPVKRTWTQVATLAGLKARGGHFNQGKRALLDRGEVKIENDLVSVVRPSSSAAPPSSDPAAVVEVWANVLTGAAPKILRLIFESGGRMDREAVAASLGMAPRGGHWNAAWKELRDNGVITISGSTASLTELFRPQ